MRKIGLALSLVGIGAVGGKKQILLTLTTHLIFRAPHQHRVL